MNCPYCGATLKNGSTFCKHCDAAIQNTPSIPQMMGQDSNNFHDYYQTDSDELGYLPENQQALDYVPITFPKQRIKGAKRGKPSLAMRIPLQIFSFLLSIVLFVCVLATALLMDCNRMLSAAGIKQVMNAVFSVSQSRPVVGVMSGAVGAGVRMDAALNVEDALSNIELPADVLTSGDAEVLVDWLCTVASDIAGQDVQIDRKQLQTLVEQSTLTDYLSEKAAGYAADFINGTADTQITSEELMDLLEENESLIENTFQFEFTGEMKQQLEAALEQTIEQNNLNEVIHEQVFSAMEETLNNSLPVEWEKIQAILQMLTSDELMLGAIGLCVLIMLLLCVLNFYNVPGGMTWSALPCIFAGGLLSLPVALLLKSPALLTDMLEIPGMVAQLVLPFLSVFATVHYGLLTIGVALLALSILWRIIRATSRPA